MWNTLQHGPSLYLALLLLTGGVGYSQQPIAVQSTEIWDHANGSPGVIHSKVPPQVPGEEAVTLHVIVDATGAVESAKAVAGPAQFFAEAEGIEERRTFEPFVRNGVAVRVAFSDYISIVPPEQWAETYVPFPEIKDWNSLRIKLKRTACYGSCPDYSVEVRGDGEVTFQGRSNVLIPGNHRGKISKQSLQELFKTFRRANYFSTRDEYAAMITDNPSYTTSVEFDGHSKSVHDYVGLRVGMPEAVKNVEDSIDRLAGTAKWIKGNEQTGAALVGEKWNFRADTEENRELFAKVVASGSPELTRLFVSKGAPTLSMTKDGDGALVNAAEKGDLELVQLMLGEQTNLPPALLSCALGAAAHSGNVELANFLIDKGADVNGPACGRYGKPTVLMRAAQTGKAEMVEMILDHHPDVNLKDSNGATSLVYALEGPSENADTAKTLDLLIGAGADVNSRDNQQQTPIFMACMGQHVEGLRALISAGADVNAKDRNGQTVLMTCFGNAALKVVIEGGADLTIRNQNGRTAAEESRQIGALDKAELLEAAMKQRGEKP
jgi:ankyrin repeat protein